MTDIPFVDAHVHFWDLDRLRYAWLTPPFADHGPNGSVEAIATTYLPGDYRRETARWNVVGMVHVDAGADPTEALAETEWLEGLAEHGGMPTGIVAFAALNAPDVATLLAAQAARPRVRGIRHIVNWHGNPARSYTKRDVTADPTWEAGYAQLAEHGLSFDLQCYPGQMGAVAAIIERHPNVPVMINHMGMPVLSDPDGLGDWRRGMAELAALPHVATKLSGMGFVDRAWTIDGVRPLILEAIDLFGTARAMFASDLPTDRLFGSVDRHLDAYHTIVADFSRDERQNLFGRNANRLYRLDLEI